GPWLLHSSASCGRVCPRCSLSRRDRMTAIVLIQQDPGADVPDSCAGMSTQMRVPRTHARACQTQMRACQTQARARRIQARGRPDSGGSVPIGVGQPDAEHGALESVAFLTAALHVHGSPEPPDRLDDQRQPDPARARLLMALPLVGLDPVVLRPPAPLEDRVGVLLVDPGPVIADLDRESPGTTG